MRCRTVNPPSALPGADADGVARPASGVGGDGEREPRGAGRAAARGAGGRRGVVPGACEVPRRDAADGAAGAVRAGGAGVPGAAGVEWGEWEGAFHLSGAVFCTENASIRVFMGRWELGKREPAMLENPAELIQKLLEETRAMTRELARHSSIAGVLAENEPIGDLVVYSLLDDTAVRNDLGARFRILSEWLTRTEELYKAQFPEGFPQDGDHYYLRKKPPHLKTRFEIFKEQALAWEESKLWSAEISLSDPLVVIKRIK